jgi:hypothetical protein
MRSPSCLCACVSPYQLLNSWTNLDETWYVCHGTYTHLNGVLHKSLPSVCVSVCVSLVGTRSINCIPHSVARQRLREDVPAATNTLNRRRIFWTLHFLCGSCLMEGECVGLSLLLLGNVPAAMKNC